MGSSNSKPKNERYVIHIKKCTIKDNNIYLYDGKRMAKIIVDDMIKYKNEDSGTRMGTIEESI
jgi:hypothetical protein